MKALRFNLTAAWRDISETLNPARWLEKIRAYRQQATAELDDRRKAQATIEANLSNLTRHPGTGSGSEIQRAGLATLALILVLVDIPVQFALNQAFLPDVPAMVWAVSAPFLALGIAAAVHGVIVAFATDRDRPARSVRLARAFAWLAFLVALSSAGILLLARIASPDMAGRLEDFATLALFGAAEGFPVAGGAFSAWWHFLSEPALEKRRLARVQRRIRDLEQFLDRLNGEDSSGTT
ncbi:MAG: hypothetical protein HY704_11755 [Gemmatimonadetes bacterium]|nr:hypothetical protein [Gemmatimonadota bacterium]